MGIGKFIRELNALIESKERLIEHFMEIKSWEESDDNWPNIASISVKISNIKSEIKGLRMAIKLFTDLSIKEIVDEC